MSSYHNIAEANQNLGNVLGTRPSVKISWTAKQQESGNQMKSLLGYSGLTWSTDPDNKLVTGDKRKQTKNFATKNNTMKNGAVSSTNTTTFHKNDKVFYLKKQAEAKVISVDNTFGEEISYVIQYSGNKEANTTREHLCTLEEYHENRKKGPTRTKIFNNNSRWQTSNSQYGSDI